MLSKEFEKSLLAVVKELNDNGIQFVLIASANSALQGVNVKPKDIDIVVKYEDVDKALSCLAHFFIEEIHSPEQYVLHLGVFGVDVEIRGNKNPNSPHMKALNAKKETKLNGEKIFILQLEKSIEFYEGIGKHEKAKEIQEFLNKKK
ncbi:MAG: hypothetical protein Q7S21_03340 [archaeon]|nr:hypothetical protein [archaeon]